MVDYQAVAVFLAAATWLATALLGKPLKLFLGWINRKRLARTYQCQALVWGHLPMTLKSGGLSRPPTNSVRWENDGVKDDNALDQVSATKAFLEVIDTMFGTRPKNIDRPPYLNEKKKYLRTDCSTLLAFLLSKAQDGKWTASGGGSSTSVSVFTFTAGPVSGRFHRNKHENETYIVGRLLLDSPNETSWRVNPDNYGQPKEVLRLIAHGYPPWYRDRIKTHSGARISHPIKTLRGAQRGGWIVGIGLSVHEPLKMYNGKHSQDYRQACTQVYKRIEKAIQPAYSDSPGLAALCEVARREIWRMNSNESGSGLSVGHWNLWMPYPALDTLDAARCRFAMRIFDEAREQPLEGDDKIEFEPIVAPVLRAAIEGVYAWWQYRNNSGGELPEWLLDDANRHSPIWIEN
jgi:hypothetical protein